MLVGLYENGIKIDEIRTDEHTSEALICILDELNSRFDIKTIVYANGPGSFMGLKVSYVILKTFSIINGCDFLATSGFELNGNGAIMANKTFSFVKENDKIVLKKVKSVPFALPDTLGGICISDDTLPQYIISAI